MSLVLNTSELLAAATTIVNNGEHGDLTVLVLNRMSEAVVAAQTNLADLIAFLEDVDHIGTEDEGLAFAGLCSSFRGESELLQGYDPGGEG